MFRVDIVFVGRHDTAGDTLFKGVDLGGSEFACRDALLKEHVEFGKSAACGLGDAEVRVDNAEEADTTLL